MLAAVDGAAVLVPPVMLRDAHLLLTGGAGFIGSALTARLADHNKISLTNGLFYGNHAIGLRDKLSDQTPGANAFNQALSDGSARTYFVSEVPTQADGSIKTLYYGNWTWTWTWRGASWASRGGSPTWSPAR